MPTQGRILVVDDDPALREAISEALTDEGFEVSSAANGAEALAQLAAGPLPGLILLDLAMPVMDGAVFRRAQRADPRFAGISVVVVSATDDPHGRLFTLRPDAFLAKPFNLARLVEMARRFCGRPSGGEAHAARPAG